MSRQTGSQVTGVCKFWNAVKGYGFLTCDDGQADLFISQHDLVTGDGGFRALTASQRVVCSYEVSDKGKAIGKNVTGPNGTSLPSFKDMYTAKRQIEGAKPPDPNKLFGSIKWFDAAKSFGFIIPQAGGEDIFFHLSECLKAIVPAEGDAVEYTVKQDKNGKTVGATIKNKTNKTRKFENPAVAQAAPGYPQGYAPVQYGRKTGTVKFFDEAKGYGFIVPDFGGHDIHVHKSGVMGGELAKDDAVEYDEEIVNGKPQATLVARSSATPSKKPRTK